VGVPDLGVEAVGGETAPTAGARIDLGRDERLPGRRLLVRLGPVRFALIVGAIAVVCSVVVTALVLWAVTGSAAPTTGLVIAAVVPMLLAPPQAWYLASLALDAENAWRAAASLATIDPLTGTLNRRRFYELGLAAYSRAVEDHAGIAVVLLDVDNFKQVNDQFGHATGDSLLTAVAAACQAQLREDDRLARYGGEDFVVLLPRTSRDDATRVGERLRSAVDALRVPTEDGTGVLTPTISVGVSLGPAEGTSFDGLVARADHAMYDAKRNGKNQVSTTG
jgi:diguanylate cyclase (GGDEF)-like protein